MPRQPRVHFPGAIFHVIVRGNNQQPVFLNDDDKFRYLNRIEFYQQKFPFQIFAYVLMSNHAHLIIQVQDHQLAQIMQGIQQSYTHYYNRKYDCSGHVFQQRYKALLCQKDDYLLALIKYIHLNPVRAGITSGPDYQWSSHSYYIGNKKGKLVNTEFVLNMLGRSDKNGWKAYSEFMKEKISEDMENQLKQQKTNSKEKDLSSIFEELLVKTSENYGIDVQLIMQKRTDAYTQRAKTEVIKSLVLEHNWSQAKVAEFFGINRSSVSKILKRF